MGCRITALVAAACIALGCSVVVKSKAGDRPDGSVDAVDDVGEDAAGDVPLDFDPDTCGLWGQIYLENIDDINIDTADPTLDGYGSMQAALLTTNDEGDPISVGTVLEDIDALNRTWYCVPQEMITGVESGFLNIIFIDTMSYWEEEQYNQFKSVIPDPLIPALYISSIYDPTTDYSVYTDLYWDGSTSRFDIPLTVRTSRLPLEVTFEGFSFASGRRARLCAYAVAVRESPTFNFAAVGAMSVDLADGEVADGTYGPIYVNIAVETGQQYKVFVYYVQDSHIFDAADSAYFRCGGATTRRSCDLQCGVLTGQQGTVIGETFQYTITPIDGICDLDELSVCP